MVPAHHAGAAEQDLGSSAISTSVAWNGHPTARSNAADPEMKNRDRPPNAPRVKMSDALCDSNPTRPRRS